MGGGGWGVVGCAPLCEASFTGNPLEFYPGGRKRRGALRGPALQFLADGSSVIDGRKGML